MNSTLDKAALADRIRSLDGSVLMGIDGMIDEVWELLASRTGPGDYTKMTRMMEFGEAITQRGTGGLAKERLLKRRCCGGFCCNTGRATATLGCPTTLLGMFGAAPHDPAFDEFKGVCDLVSLGEPAHIHVLEFSDGKIFMPNLDALLNLRWQDVVERVGEPRLRALCDVDILGMGYWSNLYDFEAIMDALVHSYLPQGKTRRVFHDFANLSKRSPQALQEAVELLARLNSKLPQTLSLNEHEGGILAQLYGIDYPGAVNARQNQAAVEQAAIALQQKTGLDEIIIHTLYFAVVATATQGAASALPDSCENPVKTTGAGDTFNGG